MSETLLAKEIFAFVLAIAIPAILFGFIYANSNNIAFHQEVYVKDIALTINSMLSVEGKIIISYPISSKYRVELNKKEAKVIVYVKDYLKEYPYIPSKNFDIKLERKGEVLVISKI